MGKTQPWRCVSEGKRRKSMMASITSVWLEALATHLQIHMGIKDYPYEPFLHIQLAKNIHYNKYQRGPTSAPQRDFPL